MAPPRNTEDTFWRRVTKSRGCWVWTGTVNNSNGYGYLRWPNPRRGRSNAEGAHRLAWILAHGHIPRGKHVLHHCDNKLCVKTEPDAKYQDGHLFIGTNLDNIVDKCAKGRGARGEMFSTARLTDERVKEIAALRHTGVRWKDISSRFGVHIRTVFRAHRRETWGHVE